MASAHVSSRSTLPSLMSEGNLRILKARAKLLAVPFVTRGEAALEFQSVRFCLGNEAYALATDSIRAVVPLKELAEIPCTPAFVMGLINVRGQLVTVISIEHLFGVSRSKPSEAAKVIIVSSGGSEIGVLADAVLGIFPVKLEGLQGRVPTSEGIRAALTRGVTAEGLIILDAEKLLAHPSIVVSDQMPG